MAHGFLRHPDGSFTKFDVPRAGIQGTFPQAINEAGVITGSYSDAKFVSHGFVRAVSGAIITFNAPGGTGGTDPTAINGAGIITGYYLDGSNAFHGFARAADGTLTTFNVPGAAQGFGFNGTLPADINPAAAIVGTYTGANDLESHGFVRTPSGHFFKFDPPPRGSIPFGFASFDSGPVIYNNAQGVITGTYFELIPGNPFTGDFRVYVLLPGGFFLAFDAANYTPCCIWSFPTGINPTNVITGSFNNGFNINHGFVRTVDASVTTFDAPGAGTGFNQGTIPLGINPTGVITGFYIDKHSVNHGFLRTP